MIETVKKDILTVEKGIICHQVNCRGVMGAGLAKAIAKKWPQVERKYAGAVRASRDILGACLLTDAQEGIIVANLFGQRGTGTFQRQTHYGALANAMCELRQANIESYRQPLYIPYGMGCGLGGGDWTIVHELIAGVLKDQTVYICKKE